MTMHGSITRSVFTIMGAILAVPAAAVPITFEDPGDRDKLNSVLDAHGIDDTWQKESTAALRQSSFALADRVATAQTLDDECLDTGLGPIINVLLLHGGPLRAGVKRGSTVAGGNALDSPFMVKPELGDPWKWLYGSVLYTQPETELFQRVLFTTTQSPPPAAGVTASVTAYLEDTRIASPTSTGRYADRSHAAFAEPAAWRVRGEDGPASLPCGVAMAGRP